MILGTAGHVDHGKTALVKALTGVDTDRLAEEKRRGITIDLGFAPLRLTSGETLGIVDVPGHEAFVRNMLAGATGVDLALLVVAADEGVMPQTREHLAIVTMLGVRGGVVALTKADLVDDEWMTLIAEDVQGLVAGTPLETADVVPVSSVSGHGIDSLRSAIERATAAIPAREVADLFRMPVDRAFTVRGTGTVVTGTVWSGSLERDGTVRLLPGDRVARVRGLESHGVTVDRVGPGTRAAIALAGIDVAEAPRGAVVVTHESWRASAVLLAEVALLDDGPPLLGPRTHVRFHLGTADVGARVVAAGGPLARGERRQARVVLDAPIVARAGDRFVLRSASPLRTIGGGMVEDPAPDRRRPRPGVAPAATTARERFLRRLEGAGSAGLARADLAVRLGISPDEVQRLERSAADDIVPVGDLLYDARVVRRLAAQIADAVAAHHATAPLDAGLPLGPLRASVGANDALIDVVLRQLESEGKLELRGAVVAEPGWRPTLSAVHAGVRQALREVLYGAGREPPTVEELAGRFGPTAVDVLRFMEREGEVVGVAADRYYSVETVERLISDLRSALVPGREYSPSELRDLIGTSRKFLIPLLEYCDRRRVTERRPNGRVLVGA